MKVKKSITYNELVIISLNDGGTAHFNPHPNGTLTSLPWMIKQYTMYVFRIEPRTDFTSQGTVTVI